MFGFEFSTQSRYDSFKYDINEAIPANSIEYLAPLVWQEHCVECGMPECYKTCARYQPRSDGRCILFKKGIVRVKNPNAILGQNAVIEMREWGKLGTFFFHSAYSYSFISKVNGVYVFLAKLSQLLKNGKIRRFCYYIKEYISRKIGRRKTKRPLPRYLLIELYNDGEEYSIALENYSNNCVVFRRTFKVKYGYNRFLIPSQEFRYSDNPTDSLCIYSSDGVEIKLNIISLAMVDFKAEYEKQIVPTNNKKVKLVVWDLDNTLWDGVLSEDGEECISLKQDLVSIVKQLDEKGIINSIASKNDCDKVMSVLRKFEIDSYFVMPMINWNPKSQNIKAIAKNIDLSMDTFVFVDDTPNELQEVLQNCMGIRVCSVENILDFVKTDAFDVPITEESRKRRQMYQISMLRNQHALQYEDNIDDFLRDCKMVMHLYSPQEDEVERCFELLQRTNQLNISAVRLSREELETLLASSEFDCYRIKVNDKYGDYGLVGFAAFDKTNKEKLVLRHFVFSCRAARKKLEQSFFEKIIDIYKEKGFESLRLVCKKTERNALMQSVLEECGLFRKEDEFDDEFVLTASMNEEHTCTNIVEFCTD